MINAGINALLNGRRLRSSVQPMVQPMALRRGVSVWRRSFVVMPVLLTSLFACSGTDTAGVPPIGTVNPYTRLQLNVRAAVMSTVPPYDTLQLIPRAYGTKGNVIPLPGPAMYSVNDTTVKVSASGLVKLIAKSGSNAMVIARVQDTVLHLTHSDTVFILGTTTTPASPLASFSIHPVGSDSAVFDIGNGTKTPTVTALDGTGTAIPAASLKRHYAVTDVSVAKINAQTGAITPLNPGTMWVLASTTYYGVTKTDSVQFRIGYQDTLTVQPKATALPNGTYRYYWSVSNLVTGSGKTVIFAIPDLFVNITTKLLVAGASLPVGDRQINEGVQVVFDDSSAAQASALPSTWLTSQFAATGSGNINLQIPDSVVVVDSVLLPVTDWSYPFSSVKFTNYCKSVSHPCAAARSFSMPGTYHFTSPAIGASGTITVVAP